MAEINYLLDVEKVIARAESVRRAAFKANARVAKELNYVSNCIVLMQDTPKSEILKVQREAKNLYASMKKSQRVNKDFYQIYDRVSIEYKKIAEENKILKEENKKLKENKK